MGKRVMRYRRRRFRFRGVICLVVLLCVVTSVAYVIFRPDPEDNQSGTSQDANPARKDDTPNIPQVPETDNGDITMPEIDPDGDGSQTGDSVKDPSTDEEPAIDADGSYTFGTPVPEGTAVEDSWFDDAVFLGDSRTEGFQLYSGIKNGTFFWNDGISVFHVDDAKHRKFLVGGQKMTMMEALATGTWNKVYIMMGTNDLGYQVSAYEKALATMVDRVLEIQPDAVVYLQTMPPVNEAQAKQSGLGSYVNNTNVDAFNEAIVRVAEEKQVALLDVAECLRSENGDLATEDSSDGVHFYRAGYETWLEYLRCHTIDADTYWSSREA